MFVDLDSPDCRDPLKVGSKASSLAAARASGVAVLPGWVVPGAVSRGHMELGAGVLAERGSGSARLAVMARSLDFADDLITKGAELADRLLVRSSTLVEASGEWSGAFASYVDITPPELPKAVVGCWASAYSVSALERQRRSGVEPGSLAMAVLVQPALQPEAGGWARLSADGGVTVHGVKGLPAPLLQGWETGATATYQGEWSGDEMIELIGEAQLEALRGLLGFLAAGTGFNQCEWALTDRVWALQVGKGVEHASDRTSVLDTDLAAQLTDTVRAVMSAPGLLGEEMVLPWALGGLPEVDLKWATRGDATAESALELCRELTEQVWARPWPEAIRESERVKSKLLALDASAMDDLRRLDSPDPRRASLLLATLRSLRIELADRGRVADQRDAWQLDLRTLDQVLRGRDVEIPSRLGTGRWEPFIAAVILGGQERHQGTPASPGVGAGPRAVIVDPYVDRPPRRAVVTSTRPTANIASVLWDASGLVTATGSPAAHLFEAARALRIPAVTGVDPGMARGEIVAVDGYAGLVATLNLDRGI